MFETGISMKFRFLLKFKSGRRGSPKSVKPKR